MNREEAEELLNQNLILREILNQRALLTEADLNEALLNKKEIKENCSSKKRNIISNFVALAIHTSVLAIGVVTQNLFCLGTALCGVAVTVPLQIKAFKEYKQYKHMSKNIFNDMEILFLNELVSKNIDLQNKLTNEINNLENFLNTQEQEISEEEILKDNSIKKEDCIEVDCTIIA